MHGTCARFDLRSLLSLLSPQSLIAPVVSIAFSVVPVTGVEIAKTNTSFLTLFSDFEDTCSSNTPSDGRGSSQLGRCLSCLSRLS